MKILCPTDLSSEANNAVAFAAKVAQQTGATLTLLNVQVLSELTPSEALYGRAANMQNAQDVLDTHARQVASSFKISCDAIVSSSIARPVSAIDKASAEFDLIVMGTDGPNNFVQSIEGSRTYKFVSWSLKPVVVVPLGVGFSHIARIIFAYDFRRKSNAPMKQLVSFATAAKAKIVALQVIEQVWNRSIELQIEKAKDDLKQAWGDKIEIDFKVVYANDHLESVKNFMKAADAEILAIAFNDESWKETLLHRGTTRSILEGASFPVLVVHQ